MTRTWFAVCYRKKDGSGFGYALDAYPAERARYMRDIGRRNIVGEFATREQALAAVIDALTPARPTKVTA